MVHRFTLLLKLNFSNRFFCAIFITWINLIWLHSNTIPASSYRQLNYFQSCIFQKKYNLLILLQTALCNSYICFWSTKFSGLNIYTQALKYSCCQYTSIFFSLYMAYSLYNSIHEILILCQKTLLIITYRKLWNALLERQQLNEKLKLLILTCFLFI